MNALDLYKTVLIISPQLWTHNRVSKHHYAELLAKQGHDVYFLEPPQTNIPGGVAVQQTEHPNLSIISYSTWFPYHLKFKARWIFNLLMRIQAKIILAKSRVVPDLVWDFDNAYQFSDLRVFGAKLNVFHPVDNLPHDMISSKSADVVFSNAQRYLDRIASLPRFSKVVQHGVTSDFIKRATEVSTKRIGRANSMPGKTVNVGYVGNLMRPGIDWQVIKKSAERLSTVQFLFVGPFDEFAGGEQKAVKDLANVNFTGSKTTSEILDLAREIDVWLMAYDRQKDIDGGTNPHKLLEYLATGKVVVTNWVESFCDTDLIVMPDTTSNRELPDLLTRVISDLVSFNSDREQARRAKYTLDFGYEDHILQIHNWLREAWASKNSIRKK